MPNGTIPSWIPTNPVIGSTYTSPDGTFAVTWDGDKFVAVPPSEVLSLADAIAIRDAVDADAASAAASQAVASAAATTALAYPDGQVVAHLNVLKSIERKATQSFNFADEQYVFYDLATLTFKRTPVAEAMTVVRSSTATANHPQGLVSYPVNGLRIAHDPVTGERLGALVEPSQTRLNTVSALPSAPEVVTVTAAAHTISFSGTGSVVISGAATGTLTGTGSTVVSLTFTPTAGALTITPSGSVVNLQLELGSFATSRIIGGEGTQVTRTADDVSKALAAPNAAEGTLLCEFSCTGLTGNAGFKPILKINNSANLLARGFGILVDSSNRVNASIRDSLVFALATYSIPVLNDGVSCKAAVSFNDAANTISISVNGGAVVTVAQNVNLATFNTHLFLQGSNVMLGTPTSLVPTIYRQVHYIPRALTDAELIAWSKP